MSSTRIRTVVLALLAVAATLLTTAGPAAAADTRHAGRFWVWFGPKTWHASYGAYGITVESPAGHDVIDLGFSSTVCANGANYAASVTNYFAGVRKTYSSRVRIAKAGAIVHPRGTGTTYRRQSLRVTFTSGGVRYIGAFVFDYDYQTTVSTGFSTVNYCYQRSLAMYAPAARFDKSAHAQLQKIFNSFAYSGPGVPNKKEDPTL
jgi:hypothetical protein